MLSTNNSLVDETLRTDGSDWEGVSKSPGDLLEHSDGCAETQRVMHGGRLPSG